MVADDTASRSLWLGDKGALSVAQPGAICIESSTISPAWCEELARAAMAARCAFLDAPVTGSKTQAASGELRFLVGGASETLERARPLLSAMGKETLHLGPTGAGARMKLINNFVCGIQAAALAEGVALTERVGLDRETALSVLANGAPGSPLVNAAGPRASDVAAMAGVELPVRPRKRIVYHVDSPTSLGAAPLTIDPTGIYFRPEGPAYVSGWSPRDGQPDPDTLDLVADRAPFESLVWPALAHRVPAFDQLRLLR